MNIKWFIEIDVSKHTLDVAIHSEKSKSDDNYTRVTNDSQGLKELTNWMKKRVSDWQGVMASEFMENRGELLTIFYCWINNKL
jgi:hypothetical protein